MTIFKAMGRETPPPLSLREAMKRDTQIALKCEKCGSFVHHGDWPFCKGRPEDHAR